MMKKKQKRDKVLWVRVKESNIKKLDKARKKNGNYSRSEFVDILLDEFNMLASNK